MVSREEWNHILKTHIPDGNVFVEIGAYDGDSYSNTAHLADIGWKGYYFEPVIEYSMQCKNRHAENNIEVLPVAVGKPGIKRFYVSELLSTLHGKAYQKSVSNLEWFKEAKFRSRKVVVVHPRILPKCDLLVIDVEGAEHFIVDKMRIRPKIIMVELHEESKAWQNIIDTRETVKLLESKGYIKIYADDVDSIFVYGA